MQEIVLGITVFLLVTICFGAAFVLAKRQKIERLLAIQLFGTTGVASLLLMAEFFGLAALRDVALVLALLAAIVAVAFVKNQQSE